MQAQTSAMPSCSETSVNSQRRYMLGIGACLALQPLAFSAYAQSRSTQRTSSKKRRYPLQPGQFYWIPQAAPNGPVVAVVNLHTQMVQVFRNGIAIGFSSSSSGKPGYGTPSGLFSILEKRRFHRSSTYNNAPMPWMVRLTWSGVAFHAGPLPGYPASHGCIRLPSQFAPKFFGAVVRGDTVWITNTALPEETSPMTMLAPITPDGQALLTPAAIEQAEYWNPMPENAPSQALPLSLLASLSQQRLYVLHQGQLLVSMILPAEISNVQLDGGALFEWKVAEAAPVAASTGQWHPQDINATQIGESLVQHVLPAANPFVQRLRGMLGPDSRLFISHLPAINDLHLKMMQQQEKLQARHKKNPTEPAQ